MRTSRILSAVLLALAVLVSAPGAQGQVHVVDPGSRSGKVWNVSIDSTGNVVAQREIGAVSSGLVSPIVSYADDFAWSVENIGDVNGDGVADLFAGSSYILHGFTLFLNADGSLQGWQHLEDASGTFGLGTSSINRFGYSVAALGDLDLDGVVDFAIGEPGYSSGRGRVRTVFLNSDGTYRSVSTISGLGLGSQDRFSESLSCSGDLDGDGIQDLLIGVPGGSSGGQLRIGYLRRNGRARAFTEIDDSQGGFSGVLDSGDEFGASVCSPGDLDGDGVLELAVGARRDDDGGSNVGAVWILFMNADETVRSEQKISATAGGFGGSLSAGDGFGTRLAAPGDLDGDGIGDLLVGVPFDDDGSDRGVVWLIHLNANGTVKSEVKISSTQVGPVDRVQYFGRGLTWLGDLNGDGFPEFSAAAEDSDDGADPDADFGDLQEAIDTVADGDVLLVREARYSVFDINGKSLTLLADGGTPFIAGLSEIRNLTSNQSVRLQGFQQTTPLGLRARFNEGTVWVEDCRVGLWADRADSLVLQRCLVEASPFLLVDEEARAGAYLRDSAVHAFDTEFQGVQGSCFVPLFEYECNGAQSGGPGIDQDGGFLSLAGCRVVGGSGGVGASTLGGPGGPGLRTSGEVHWLDTTFAGGPGGCPGGFGGCTGTQGSDGSPIVASPSATLDSIQARALSLSATSPGRENETITLTFTGPRYAPVWLGESTRPTSFYFPPANGSVVLRLPIDVEFIGVTDADGTLTRTFRVEPLVPGVDSRIRFIQPYYLDLNGLPIPVPTGSPARRPTRPILGAGALVVELDERF